jgi:integrating conjugative element protein (TIGR03765 family)
VTLDALLPIRTPEMSPGAVRARGLQAAATGARPLFLIGTDPLSLEWLEAHRERLIELGAVGMLIEAESVAAVRQVAARAEGLKILPASGAELARALGVRHYPVLISARGIEQ